MLCFAVPGEPVPWARARLGRTGIHFTPGKQRSYMTTVRDYAAAAMGDRPLYDGPLELKILCVFLLPKSAPKRRPPLWKRTRPDASNHVKLVEDALNGVVWKDDAQVASLHVWKKYGERPEMHVEVAPLFDPVPNVLPARLPVAQPSLALESADA